MKYKLYNNGKSDISNIVKVVLQNRGIDDYKKYLNLDESVVIPYEYLDNMEEAVQLFLKHYNNKNKIRVLIDEDVDGYCSGSMMINYIKRLDNEYPVDYILHGRAKAHGLSNDVIVPEDTKLLIIPDAGTNDAEQCKALKNNGIDILILDHHEMEEENKYAIIVNNQISKNYYNKELCGAGVVYRFLQAVDAETWNEYADDYLDLCALANISDVMDIKSFETRYFVNSGLFNIRNKCFKALIKAQDYSMGGKINVHNIQWSVTPILNGCIRVGSQDDKELLFRAFIEQDEFFEYKKRASKGNPAEVIQESIYDRAARLCKNAKSRQDKSRDKGVQQIVDVIGVIEEDSSKNKVIMVDTTEILDSGLTGLVAIKIAEMYNKPCLLLNKYFDKKLDKYVYGGSARNIDNSPIDNLKDIVNSTNIIKGQGHGNAFGIIALDIDKKDDGFKKLNSILKDVEYDSTYYVDYILNVDDVSVQLCRECSEFEDIIGQGISEPLIAVENISLTKDCFDIFGKNEDTISFNINDIKYIMFKCKDGNGLYDFLQNAWDDEDQIIFSIVGKPGVNEYEGTITPQIVIENVEVISESVSENDDEEW